MLHKWIATIGLAFVLTGCSHTENASQTSQNATATQSVAQQDVPDNTVNLEKATRLNLELAVAYLDIGNVSRAKEKLNRAMKLGPNVPDVYAAHGYYYEKIGEIESAEESYLKAIKIDGKSGQYRNNYGAFLCRQARYEEAEKEFLTAVKDRAYPKAAETYENLGLCSLETKDTAKAKQYFQRAIKQDASRYEAMLELGVMSFEEKDVDTASQYFDRYRQGTEYTARALWLGIKIAEQKKNADQAASLLLLLKSKFPNSKEYQTLQTEQVEQVEQTG